MTEQEWLDAIEPAFAPQFFEGNRQAFLLGRASQPATNHAIAAA